MGRFLGAVHEEPNEIFTYVIKPTVIFHTCFTFHLPMAAHNYLNADEVGLLNRYFINLTVVLSLSIRSALPGACS
jgi:hypothetical protein